MEIKQVLWEKDQKQEEERVSAPEPMSLVSEADREGGEWAGAVVPRDAVRAESNWAQMEVQAVEGEENFQKRKIIPDENRHCQR